MIADVIRRLERLGAAVLPDPSPDATKARPDGWTFDAASQRWRWPNTGRAVPQSTVNDLLARRQDAVRESMREHARALAAGRINAAEFEIRMRAAVKEAHIQARLLAIGGKGNATDADWGAVGSRLRREYRYLSEFAAASGALSEAQLVNRAGMYAGAAVKDAYASGQLRGHVAAGYAKKRRVGPNDKGTCQTCRTEIASGWVDISSPGWAIGHSECLANCRCAIEYSMR